MKLVEDFFNKLASEIDKTYFPNLKYYRDDTKCANIHYAIELYSNGCTTYKTLINKLAKNTKETKQNLHVIVSKHVIDFEDFKYEIN